MTNRRDSRSGQTMVEYIIIVVLIAITLLVLFGKFSKATGKKVAGATSALDEEVGQEAAALVDEDPADKLRRLDQDGNF
jgi:Flp pilus assembly pilin Flp